MAAVDIASFVADLKDHVAEHGLHLHDERHLIESYSLRQAWDVDLHPDGACDGPLDLRISLEVDPRTLLAFEDAVLEVGDGELPELPHQLPMTFTFVLPPMPRRPDLLVLATDLAAIGGPELPLEVSATDSIPAVTDDSQRTLNITARIDVSLHRIAVGEEDLCDILDRCQRVCGFLLDRAPVWFDDIL